MTKEQYTDLVLEYAQAVEAVFVERSKLIFNFLLIAILVSKRNALRDRLLKEGPR